MYRVSDEGTILRVELEVGHPRHVARVALEDERALPRYAQARVERTNDAPVRAVERPAAVERVIEAVVEVSRVTFGIDKVDGALSVRGVLHVGTVPEGGRNVDHDTARLPGLALVVRPGHRRLEAVAEAA